MTFKVSHTSGFARRGALTTKTSTIETPVFMPVGTYGTVKGITPKQLDEIGFESSFKLSILTLTNTVNSQMYGLENLNFGNLLTSSKISLIIFMIIGKIELISVFLIFKKIFFKD